MEDWKVLIVYTGSGTYYKQYIGISEWEKPIDKCKTGDQLIEADTKKVYLFVDGKWYEM